MTIRSSLVCIQCQRTDAECKCPANRAGQKPALVAREPDVMSDEFPIRLNRFGWTHMRFKICTDLTEWQDAPPTHRFVDHDRLLLAASCSLCPHGEVPR